MQTNKKWNKQDGGVAINNKLRTRQRKLGHSGMTSKIILKKMYERERIKKKKKNLRWNER